jgi:transcriptional regulator with XRE-family HTH domain
MTTSRTRTRPSRLHQEPASVTWARQKSGLTKRALAETIGISEQLMGEIESGWRSATPANLAKIADALNCPVVMLERKRTYTPPGPESQPEQEPQPEPELEDAPEPEIVAPHQHGDRPVNKDEEERITVHSASRVPDAPFRKEHRNPRTEIRRWL